MNVGDIYYNNDNEAFRLVNITPDDLGGYVWQSVTHGAYEIIAVEFLSGVSPIPLDVKMIVDGLGTSFKEINGENLIDTCEKWDNKYPGLAPHRVAIFTFKEWA